MTPEWQQAAREGSIEGVGRLWRGGADIDSRDAHGQTALMIAASEGHADLVQWLVDQGAAIDTTAKYGLSALMLGVVRGHVDVVRTLVRAGANLELQGTGAPGFAGRTARDLALKGNNPAVVRALG